ncbi:hypothetical protein ACJW30_01G019700 [Castanea mollissima]
MCCPRGRELVENEEQYENKKMESIVVEEQEEEEEGSEGESETGFVDLDQDTLRNVLERVDAVTLGRAQCVNKLWRKVASDDRIWEPIAVKFWVGIGGRESLDKMIHFSRGTGFGPAVCYWMHLYVGESNFNTPSDYNSIPDFNSIDPQVFSSQIEPWVQN